MSSQTPNINLTLPTGVEKVSRQIINDNNTKIDTAIGTLNSNFIYVALSNSDYRNAKLTAAFTNISARNLAIDKSYPVMLAFGGSNFTGSFTGTINLTSGGIRFLVADENHILQGLFLRSDNTLSSIADLKEQIGYISIRMSQTLATDVLQTAKDIPIGLSFYYNSNQPAKRPTGGNWGAYWFWKQSSTLCKIVYDDGTLFAIAGVNLETATDITWTIRQ